MKTIQLLFQLIIASSFSASLLLAMAHQTNIWEVIQQHFIDNRPTSESLTPKNALQDPNIQVDSKGNTIVHIAADYRSRGNFLIMRMVLNTKDIDINKLNNMGQTPLDIAQLNESPFGKEEIIKMLTDKGAKNAPAVGNLQQLNMLKNKSLADISIFTKK